MENIRANKRTILGIDPGTRLLGYAIIVASGSQVDIQQLGVVSIREESEQDLVLKQVFDAVVDLITRYTPDEAAIETPFYGKNAQVMLKLGRAQGVAIAAAMLHSVPIAEYAPRKVKKAVTGNGNASKEQVASLLMRQFGIDTPPQYFDETDALSIALCHHYQSTLGLRGYHGSKPKKTPSGNNKWGSFINKHPERLVRGNKPV